MTTLILFDEGVCERDANGVRKLAPLLLRRTMREWASVAMNSSVSACHNRPTDDASCMLLEV
jgi:hypothetical protein